MKTSGTITIALPASIGREVEEIAKEENRTVGDLVKDAVLRYRMKKLFGQLSSECRKVVKRKKLTPRDFGGPFAK